MSLGHMLSITRCHAWTKPVTLGVNHGDRLGSTCAGSLSMIHQRRYFGSHIRALLLLFLHFLSLAQDTLDWRH